MRYRGGDATVGDAGVKIIAVADISLDGKTVYFEIIKPNGETIIRQATVSGNTASYTTVADDFDVSGEWVFFLRDSTTGYYFTKESGNIIYVRPKPSSMIRGRG